MKDLVSTLDVVIARLSRMSIEYVVMGGLAVRAYSIPRATVDVDLTLAIEWDRVSKLLDELEQDGCSIPEAYRAGWVDEVSGLKLVKVKRYVAGSTVDVDLFIADSLFQDEILKRKRLAEVDDRKLWIASPEDLVLLKLVAGRPRDLLDVADIFFTQGPLDSEYLKHWAAKLGVGSDLDNVLNDQEMM